MISVLVAATTNMVIGVDNDLPWHLPTDLKRFKELTTNKTVIMGRNTWESLPEKFRPLPNRENIVLTTNENYIANGAIVLNDINFILKTHHVNEHFIIGGGQIYEKFLPFADRIYLTEVLTEVNGDTYLKGFNVDDWGLYYTSDIIHENGYEFRFKTYKRKIIDTTLF